MRESHLKKQALLWKVFTVFLAAVLAVSLSGCSSQKGREGADSMASAHTIVDCMDRKVLVPDEIASISCLYAYAGHACVFLGCEDKITSVVDGLKRDALMTRKIEGLEEMESPYQAHAINIEELMSTEPDIVLLRTENLTNEGEVEKLEKTGIPYVVIDYSTMEEQMQSIRVIGEALSCEEKAEAYLSYYEKTIDMVKERTDAIPQEERKTVYHSVNEVVRADVKDTLSYEALQTAGIVNAIDLDEGVTMDGSKAYTTVEQIYRWDPDMILANEPEATEYFQKDSKFEGLRAVREGNVCQLPIGLSRWGHPGSIETPLAVLYIAGLVYPEYFQDIDMEQETMDFYHDFLKIDLTEDEVQNIFSGAGMREQKTTGRRHGE